MLKHTDIKDLVLELSRDDDYRNRLRAVRYLATLGDAKSKEILEYQYKFDPVAEVKLAAAKALKIEPAKKNKEKTESKKPKKAETKKKPSKAKPTVKKPEVKTKKTTQK